MLIQKETKTIVAVFKYSLLSLSQIYFPTGDIVSIRPRRIELESIKRKQDDNNNKKNL